MTADARSHTLHAPWLRVTRAGEVITLNPRARIVLANAGLTLDGPLPTQLMRELGHIAPSEALRWFGPRMSTAVSFARVHAHSLEELFVANVMDPDPRPAAEQLGAQHRDFLGASIEALEPNLRDHLTTIALNVGLLGSAQTAEADRAQAQALLKEGVAALAAMVDELAPRARDGGGDRPVPLRPVLERVVTRLRHRSALQGHTIGLEVADGLTAQTLVPVPILEQTLLALVENALESRDEGVNVTIRCRSANEGSEGTIVRVSDDGPGFSDGARALAFHPFFTTKAQHAGLGLTRCRAALGEHGGRMEVERPATGATVSLHLPRPAERGVLRGVPS